MSNAKHTPGPWIVHPLYNNGELYQITPNKNPDLDYPICIIEHIEYDRSDAEQKANAWLIAAAPELLEELKNCIKIIRVLHIHLNKSPYGAYGNNSVERCLKIISQIETTTKGANRSGKMVTEKQINKSTHQQVIAEVKERNKFFRTLKDIEEYISESCNIPSEDCENILAIISKATGETE